ncbi:MAG: Ig-like domain-containing protein [Anoxybacillus sp.]|nr:Ig-like domain-containing protein [Anoxybacillus sp.]MCL6586215.1 Ig-like domain-containing protein [Anoxybacillus sp.]
MRRKWFATICSLLCCLLFASYAFANNGDSRGSRFAVKIPAIYINVTDESVDVTVGEYKTLKASVYPENATNKELVWMSSNPAVVKVDNNGNIVGVSEGTAYVYVSTTDGTVSNKIYVTVKPKRIVPTAIMLNTSYVELVIRGESKKLEATVEPANATNKSIYWSSSNANVVAVDGNGVIKPIGVGTAIVTAKTVEGGQIATCTVKVYSLHPEREVKSLEVSENVFQLMTNESLKFKVYAHFEDGSQKEVTFDQEIIYQMFPTTIAEVKNGIIKSKNRSGKGEVKIYYNGKTVKVPVIVSKNSVEELHPSAQQVTLHAKKRTQEIELIAIYKDGTTKDVTDLATWTTDNSEVAEVERGLIKAVDEGIAKITARYDNQTAIITVDVVSEQKQLEGLTASDKNIQLFVEQEDEVKIWALYSNGEKEEVTDEDGIVWQPKNRSIVDVVDGVIVAKKPGKTSIIATYKGKSISISIVVKEKEVTRIEASTKRITLKEGEEKNIKVYAYYNDGKKVDVTKEVMWYTKREEIAIANEGIVRGIKRGTTTVYAKLNGKVAYIVVTVK